MNARAIIWVTGSALVIAGVIAAWLVLRTGDDRPVRRTPADERSTEQPNTESNFNIDPALAPALEPLVSANLTSEVFDAASWLSGLRPLDENSKTEATFGALLRDPRAAQVRTFIDTASTELRERRLDAVKPASDRPEAAEPKRQLMLRMILGVQYARSRGLLDEAASDQALWELGLQLSIAEFDDLRVAIDRLIEARLAQFEGTQAQHWQRGLLDAAMERAAQQGRADAFERYAARYIASVYEGAPEFFERDQAYRRERVASFRAMLSAGSTGSR